MFLFALHYIVSTLFKEIHNNTILSESTCKEITYKTYRIRGENQSFSWMSSAPHLDERENLTLDVAL